MTRPGRERRARVTTVTSTNGGIEGMICHIAAAVRWLKAAPGPAASNAARACDQSVSAALPDGVDAAVQGGQAPGPQAVLDRLGSDPEREQLVAAGDPVMPRGDPGDRPVDVLNVVSCHRPESPYDVEVP